VKAPLLCCSNYGYEMFYISALLQSCYYALLPSSPLLNLKLAFLLGILDSWNLPPLPLPPPPPLPLPTPMPMPPPLPLLCDYDAEGYQLTSTSISSGRPLVRRRRRILPLSTSHMAQRRRRRLALCCHQAARTEGGTV